MICVSGFLSLIMISVDPTLQCWSPVTCCLEANARRQPWHVCYRATKGHQAAFRIHVVGMLKKSVETVKNLKNSHSEFVREWLWAHQAAFYWLSSFLKESLPKELKVHHEEMTTLTSQSSTRLRSLAKLCLINTWVHREDQLCISDDQCLMARQEQSHKASGPRSDLSHCVFTSRCVCASVCVS